MTFTCLVYTIYIYTQTARLLQRMLNHFLYVDNRKNVNKKPLSTEGFSEWLLTLIQQLVCLDVIEYVLLLFTFRRQEMFLFFNARNWRS